MIGGTNDYNNLPSPGISGCFTFSAKEAKALREGTDEIRTSLAVEKYNKAMMTKSADSEKPSKSVVLAPREHYGTKSLEVEGRVLEDGTVYHSFADEEHFHDDHEEKMNKLSHLYRDPDGCKYYFDDNGHRIKVLQEREDHPDDEFHGTHLPQVDDDLAMPKMVPVSRKTFNAGWM